MTCHQKFVAHRVHTGRRARWTLMLVGTLMAAHAAADVDAPYSWEVTGPKSRHFLVGSAHLVPGPQGAVPTGIQNMYAAADSLMFETDVAALDAPEVQTGLMEIARSKRDLKAEVGLPLYAKLENYLTQLRVPVDACDALKPWFCALTLETVNYRRAGFASVDGLDEVLFAGAQQDGKSLRWLETPPENIELFTGMSDAQSKRLLQSTLHQTPQVYVQEPQRLFQAWRKDDFIPVEKQIAEFKRDYPDLYARLVSGRHHAWMPKLIQAFDRDEPQMVVVEASHLAGPDGLVALLRAHGYKLQPYISSLQPQLETQAFPLQRAVSFRTHR